MTKFAKKSGLPASGRPAGGGLASGIPARGVPETMGTGLNALVPATGEGVLSLPIGLQYLRKAEEIADLPIYDEVRDKTGKLVLDEKGAPILRPADGRLMMILNAITLVLNRRLGAVVQRTINRNIRGPEDLTEDELRALAAWRTGRELNR